MAKKQTMQQRLVAFGIAANADELNAALDTLLAFKASRFPSAKKSATRKPRADKGKSRGLNPPPKSNGDAENATEV